MQSRWVLEISTLISGNSAAIFAASRLTTGFSVAKCQLELILNRFQTQKVILNWRCRGNVSTGTVLNIQDSAGDQELYRFANRSPADIKLICQLVFIRQFGSNWQLFRS